MLIHSVSRDEEASFGFYTRISVNNGNRILLTGLTLTEKIVLTASKAEQAGDF
jgi:hypothetical protein